jgi:hypothetical protein
LHHDLFQQILQASGQVNSGVTVQSNDDEQMFFSLITVSRKKQLRRKSTKIFDVVLVNEFPQTDVTHPAMKSAH